MTEDKADLLYRPRKSEQKTRMEHHLLRAIEAMGEESLSPHEFENLQRIVELLVKARGLA
jgi:hypothetical protein